MSRLDDDWQWVVPDLPGHGGSGRARRYSFTGLAASVAENVSGGRPVAVLGHSLGGVVGLTLATGWFGVQVSAVCGLGIKVRWSEEDLSRAAELAGRPGQVFGDRDDAIERALKVAGLADLVAVDSAVATAGVVEVEGGWTLTMDPRAFAVGAPDMPGLLAAARAKTLILVAGEHDPMSPVDRLRKLRPDATVLDGLTRRRLGPSSCRVGLA